MTPELIAQYKADVARCRAERDAYLSRAAFQWKQKIEFNRKRRWLDALHALDRHQEYKRTAAQYAAEMKRLERFLK